MTPTQIKTAVALRAQKDISQSGSDDDDDVKSAVISAIRHITGSCGQDWPCQKKEFTLSSSTTPALTAGTYAYAMRTLLSDFRKPQSDSIRYGNTLLEWVDQIEEIDRRLGPQWKDSSASNGTPRYVTMLNNNLILAGKPSSSFVSNEVKGYYYAREALSTSDSATWLTTDLMLYEDLFFFVVELSLVFLLQQEDDSNFTALLQVWEQKHLVELRGYDESPHSDERLEAPLWGRAY